MSEVRTHIQRAGKGEPLLLVHGLGSPLMWQRVFEPLSSLFDVVTVDLPGFGESDCPPRLYSTEEYAVFLDQLLHTLGVSTLNIVGISYGGQIAATFASMFPERVKNLVLIASTGLNKPRWFARNDFIWKPVAAIIKHTVLKSRLVLEYVSRCSYYDIAARPPDLVEKFLQQLSLSTKRDTWLHALHSVLAPDPEFNRVLSDIHSRTLIVWGAEDRSVPVNIAHEFHRRIPGSTLKVISRCSHSVPWEKPGELCEAIQGFVY